jgi:predicted enzyme related to lactoylglutathione lyase
VPCWVETPQPDPGAAAEFYGELLGWTITNVGGDDVPYLIASLDGRDVAAISRAQDGAAGGPAWETYIAVRDADGAAAAVTAAGGRVTGGPFDAGETGRS